MQAQSGVKVIGTKELYRSLKVIGTPQREINAANRDAAQGILRDAKSLTPKRTGKLLRTVKISATAKSVAIQAGNEGSVPYANPIHWGWSKSAKTGQRKNIKPQPFLARALNYNRDEILQRYYDQMEALITREMAKGTIR